MLENAPQPPLVQPTEEPKDKKYPLSVEIARPDQPLSYQGTQILLSLQVSHRGSGEVRNISINIKDLHGEQKALASRKDEWLDSLKQGETCVVDIPVVLSSAFDQESLDCRADLVYQWNNEKRSTSHPLKIRLGPLNHLSHPHQENHYSEARKRVGLFVDYENGSPLGRRREEQEVGKALISYAGQFGEVVCRWVIADPRNRKDWADVETRLKQVCFEIRYPSGEPSVGKAPKNVADLALITQIYDELERTRPDIYIIVSGDADYYETIRSLINRGKTVYLCAPLRQSRISEKYFELERERHSQKDFFIDDLNTALRAARNKELSENS